MAKIGFIGLGIMGRPMAGHLLEGGHELFIHTRRAPPKALIDAGAVACANGKELADKADVIIIMVPDTPDVETVLFDAGGVAEGLSKGKIVVDMSSISPIATKEFAKKVNELGCDYLDAPVSGGEVGAKAASLTIMVGGPESAFETVKPIFALMGKNITLVGGNGDGQTTKVANQIIVALTIEAVGEALVFASKAGADPARVRQALMGGFAASRILEVHGERMIKRNFEPGFRIALHQKGPEPRAPGRALRSASACRIQRHVRSCSLTPRLPRAARHGITRAWRACSKGWLITKLPRGRPRPEARRMNERQLLRDMFEAAIAAASPDKAVPANLPEPPAGRTVVVGAGKAAASMARAVEAHWPEDKPLSGLVVTRYGHGVEPLKRIEVVEAAHPIPDAAGQKAAGRILDLVKGPAVRTISRSA